MQRQYNFLKAFLNYSAKHFATVMTVGKLFATVIIIIYLFTVDKNFLHSFRQKIANRSQPKMEKLHIYIKA